MGRNFNYMQGKNAQRYVPNKQTCRKQGYRERLHPVTDEGKQHKFKGQHDHKFGVPFGKESEKKLQTEDNQMGKSELLFKKIGADGDKIFPELETAANSQSDGSKA